MAKKKKHYNCTKHTHTYTHTVHLTLVFGVYRREVRNIYIVTHRRSNAESASDWQTADPRTTVFTAEYARTGFGGETKGTRLKGTQLKLNSVDPTVFTHTAAGLEAPFESSPSLLLLLLLLARSHLATPSRRFQPLLLLSCPFFSPSSRSFSFSRARFKRQILFSPFNSLSLIPSSLFLLLFLPFFVRCRGTRSTGVCRTLLVAKGEERRE